MNSHQRLIQETNFEMRQNAFLIYFIQSFQDWV